MYEIKVEEMGVIMEKQGLKLKEKTKSVTLKFSVARKGKGFLQAKESLNCCCLDGAIRTLPGLAGMMGDGGSAVYFGMSGLLDMVITYVLNSDNKTYAKRMIYVLQTGMAYLQERTSNTYAFLTHAGAQVFSFSFMGKDGRFWTAILGQMNMILVNDNYLCTSLGLMTQYGAGCFYKNRLFVGIKPFTMAYSAPEEPTNFTESVDGGGRIRFTDGRGEILAILPFKDALYVFFERGIARVDVVGAPKDFKVTYLEYTGGTILFRTVGACESAIFFMTTDGLYRFDGEKAELILQDTVVSPISASGWESTIAWNDGVLMRYRKRTEGNVVLAISGDGKECSYLEDLEGMSSDRKDGVLFRNVAEIGKLDVNGKELGRTCRFNAETDFEYRGRKTLRKLSFTGEGTFNLTLKNDGRTVQKTVSFQDGVATVKLSERGDRYAMNIEPMGKTVIKEVTAGFSVLG